MVIVAIESGSTQLEHGDIPLCKRLPEGMWTWYVSMGMRGIHVCWSGCWLYIIPFTYNTCMGIYPEILGISMGICMLMRVKMVIHFPLLRLFSHQSWIFSGLGCHDIKDPYIHQGGCRGWNYVNLGPLRVWLILFNVKGMGIVETNQEVDPEWTVEAYPNPLIIW